MLSKRRQILIKNIKSEIDTLICELTEQLDNETLLKLNVKKPKELNNIAASISLLKDACEELDEALGDKQDD